MPQSIHGHEILDLLGREGNRFTKQTLRAEVTRLFGETPVFHTCSANGLSFDELVAFLESRGKISETDGKLHLGDVPACSH